MAEGWGGRQHTVRRSMSMDLMEGMTDGSQKKIDRNRGGVVEETSKEARSELNDYYQFAEAPPTFHEPVPHFAKVRAGVSAVSE